jgi:hypothetical protein
MTTDLQATPAMQVLTQQIRIDLGSFYTGKRIQRPKYIDECLNNSAY